MENASLYSASGVLLAGACVCVYTGSLWSLQTPVMTRQLRKEAGLPERDEEEESESVNAESLSSEDAWLFPVIGSAVLLGLYVLFKMFDKELINMLLSAYFAVAGSYAMTMVTMNVGRAVLGVETWRRFTAHGYHLLLTPRDAGKAEKESETTPILDLKLSRVFLQVFAGASVVTAVYMYTRHWVLANIVAMCMATQGIAMLTIDSFRTGFVLLGGLFFYDIFWVFGTPVMVNVAKNFDAPIKIVWPRNWIEMLAAVLEHGIRAMPEPKLALLGLGDIVIPGVFVALALRYDQARASEQKPGLHFTRFFRLFSKDYFNICLASYVGGLVTTMVVMHAFKAAQPALLYLSPACTLSVTLLALAQGELSSLWNWEDKSTQSEEDRNKDKKGKAKASDEDKKDQ